MNTSDFLLERLVEWGFTRVYGYPGDGINGIMGAFDRIGDRLQFIQVRHEEMAAFMACAHAKFTGEVGLCLATSGPGAVHLLNGLYDAKMDHVPVVAIVGQAATSALGSSYQQEVDLQVLFQDVTEYVYTVSSPAAMRHVVDRAVRTAAAFRAVTCVIVPQRRAGEERRSQTAAYAQHGSERRRVLGSGDRASAARFAACCGRAQRWKARCHDGRPGRG